MHEYRIGELVVDDEHHPVVYDDYLIGSAIDNRSDRNRSLYDHYFSPESEIGG